MIAFINGRIPVLWLVGLLALLAMGVLPAAATPPWVVRTWQSDEGLPDNTVVGIEQTPDGFLWVATKTGLLRFDGVRFQPFPVTAPGASLGVIKAFGIKALLADRRGRLWVAKDYGVVLCVDQGVTTLVVGPEIAASGDGGERLLVLDAEGAVWVCYSGGVVLRIRDGQVRSFTEADGLPGSSACQLTMDGTGQLWFAQADWVGVFREGRFRPLAQQSFQRITGAHGADGIWGYRNRQVWKLAEGGPPVKLGTLPDDMPEVAPTAMREDRAGCLWLGTLKAGLIRFDPDGGVTAPLPQQTILTVQEDREGNLWAGTRGGGLSRLKPRVVELLTTGSAAQFEPVQSLCQDTDGILWAVVWPEGRLMRRAGQAWSTLSPEGGWAIFPSECVAADPRGGVYIGTGDAGLLHWQGGAVTETLDTTNGLATNHVGALLVTASGEVWIGSRGGADVVQCWKGGQLRTFQMPPSSGSAMALATDAAGDLWVATYGCRLLRVHGEVVTDETAATLAGVQRRHRRRIERLEMLRATERERARIARDLHGEIGGSLTKIGKLAAGLPDPAVAETTREVVLAMDQVVWTVNPRNDTLDSLATYLVHHTEEFLRPAGIACELDIPLILPDVMLASDVRHNLFLATKEALNNAVKHGSPRRVWLGLTVDGGLLTLTVRDDGCGFSPATTAAGADGLGNMRNRLASIGGELHIISAPGQGTAITLQVSLNPTKPS